MDEYTFKHCPKGHYYQGDECPYCKAQTAEKFKDCYYPLNVPLEKTCPNGHAYGSERTCCPYCGESTVCGREDLFSAFLRSITLSFNYKTTLQIDDNQECEVASLEVTFAQHCSRTGYVIYYDDGTATPALNYKPAPYFDYKSNIRIGGTTFTGKEFIKMVDFISGVKEFECK